MNEPDSKKEESVTDPLVVDLKMPPKAWILYWKVKYEAEVKAHVDQKIAAKTILDQRNALMRMIDELPKHRILQLQEAALQTAKAAGVPFVSPLVEKKKVSDISKAQRAAKKKKTRKTARKISRKKR